MCWRNEVEACSGAGCLSLKNQDGLLVGLSMCTSSMSVYSGLSLYLHKNNNIDNPVQLLVSTVKGMPNLYTTYTTALRLGTCEVYV